MDNTVLAALIGLLGVALAASIGLLSAIIGAYAGFLGSQRATRANIRLWLAEQEDKYRELTFERRLQAHQEAFNWIQKLNHILNVASMIEKRTEAQEKISAITREARDWWDNNALYLDEKSRQKMIPAINHSHLYFTNMDQGFPMLAWDKLDEALSAILEGIGTSHLPKEIKDNLTDMDRAQSMNA